MPEMNLNHLYRTLDVLADSKEEIEDYIFEKNRTLFNMSVDVVFYDVTTFHFESCEDDGLRNFGFSKANKVNEVQVVMGLLIDCEGRPIGYELFSGNTLDSKTLERSLDKLQERFNIRKVVIVADRGLNSKLNLGRIRDKGYDYIVASRLKNMGKAMLEQVFNPAGYSANTTFFEGESGEVTLTYKVIDHTNSYKNEEGKPVSLAEKMVITYSAKRARKDQADRARLIKKAEKLLANPAAIKASNKKGGKRFIEHTSENDQYSLDKKAIALDERFDGYYAIQTSLPGMSAEEVVEAYHSLWKIEESFRVMKSTLEVRPIFHWTEKRIKGHFVVCFLAFLLERTLEFKLRKNGSPMSPNLIREALNSLLFAELTIRGQQFLLKIKSLPQAGKILRLLRIAPPKNMLSMDDALGFTWQ
jgi:transposase